MFFSKKGDRVTEGLQDSRFLCYYIAAAALLIRQYLCRLFRHSRCFQYESCLFALEFSRELRRKVHLCLCQMAFLLLNSLENLSVFSLLPLLACHPSVTPVTLQKGFFLLIIGIRVWVYHCIITHFHGIFISSSCHCCSFKQKGFCTPCART